MIDVRTMLVVLALTNVTMAGLYWLAFGGRFRDGLAKWTLSFGVQGLTWLLFALRGFAPDILTVVAANALLMLVWPLQAAALLEFQGRRLAPWVMWALPLTIGGLVEEMLPDFQARVIVISALAAAGALTLAVLFFRERTAASTRVRLMMTAGYAIGAVLFAVRGLGVWLRPDSIVSAVSVSPAMSLVYIAGFLIILTTSFGMLLMHKERADEALVRYGDEEFCVLLPGIAAEGAANIAERIRHEVAHSPIRIAEKDILTTVSIGITTDHDGERTLDTLITRADEALYRAKTGGRNRIVAVNHPEAAPAADPGAAI